MSELDLNDEERRLVALIARERTNTFSRLGFYAVVLVPVALLAVYGFLKHDYIAITIALLGLLLYVVWRLIQELSIIRVYRSIFAKVLAHEEGARSVSDDDGSEPATGSATRSP